MCIDKRGGEKSEEMPRYLEILGRSGRKIVAGYRCGNEESEKMLQLRENEKMCGEKRDNRTYDKT